MFRELRWALRWLRLNPAFTAAMTGILALGIGANTAVFSIVDAILIRPLPYSAPDRLVRIEENTVKRPNIGITAAEYLDWNRRTDLFAQTAAYVRDMVTVTDANEAPDQVWLVRASVGLFPMLGTGPRLGRTPTSSDEATVILSDAFWRRRFHADPRVLGRALTIAGQLYTISGVMAPDFEFPDATADMWAPFQLRGPETYWVNVAARLKNGVALAHVQKALDVVARRTELDHPKAKEGMQIVITPWRETPAREYELTLVFLLVAVGLVLLIACADVAGLLLCSAVQRSREIAIRTALGAGFGRVISQLLAEALVLAVLGTVGGVAIASLLVQMVKRQLAALPIALPHLHAVAMNQRVLLFNAALCLLLACLLSVAPALLARRTDLQATMGTARVGRSKTSMRMFSVLIGGEAAFAFILLTCSGLMIRSLIRLEQTDHGIHADHVLTIRVPIGTRTNTRDTKYDTKLRQMAFYKELLGRLQQVPGVRAAAFVNNLPLSGSTTSVAIDLPEGQTGLVVARTVSPGYFQAMGIPLLAGRFFTDADQMLAPGVGIINQFMAHQFFPGSDVNGRDVIGRALPQGRSAGPPTIVVGVVADAAQLSVEQPAKGELYRPYQQFIFGVFLSTIVVRTSGDPLALASALRHEIWAVDATQPIVKIATMDDVIEQSIWRPRFSAWIFSVLGGLALLLTCAGVYSVIAYTTTLRAREVGIRVALGAVPQSVVALLVRQALLPLAAGLVISLIASLSLSRLLASLLYKTSTADPLTYVAAGTLLLLIGLIASATPAWKAATADPMQALRTE